MNSPLPATTPPGPLLPAGNPRIIGIVNITEDSVSDGGRYLDPAAAISHARKLRAEGADIIELGPAASHPDSAPVTAAEEQKRLAPVLGQLTAVRRGFSVIEVDLRATADGHIVIMHDETVDRTTNGCGQVSELTLAELRSLDAGSYVSPQFADQKVPTFQEVLAVARGTGTKIVLDIKLSPRLDHQHIVQLAEQSQATLDVIIGPRSLAGLRDFKRLNPNLRTLGLVPGEEFAAPPRDAAEEFARAGAGIIRLWPPWIFTDRDHSADGDTSPLIERLHHLGKPVWTTADVAYRDISPERPREDLAELVRLGINGVLTDVPDLLRDVLAARTENR